MLGLTQSTFYEVTGIAIPSRNLAPSSGSEMVSAVPITSPSPSEPVVAITSASDPAPTFVAGQPEPPMQNPKPAPTPEELGVSGLDTIPPRAEVVWVTSSEEVAAAARDKRFRPIVVMKEWQPSLGSHSVFRDAKELWHIRPRLPSNDLGDAEEEVSEHLQASLKADRHVKLRLHSARANFIPLGADRQTVPPPPPPFP
jgi:hypothetical protein